MVRLNFAHRASLGPSASTCEGKPSRGSDQPVATVVTWILSRVENGTRLRLVHSGFVTPKNDSAFKTMSEVWKKVVQSIGTIAGGKD